MGTRPQCLVNLMFFFAGCCRRVRSVRHGVDSHAEDRNTSAWDNHRDSGKRAINW